MYLVERANGHISISTDPEGEGEKIREDMWLIFRQGGNTQAMQLRDFRDDGALLVAMANRVKLF